MSLHGQIDLNKVVWALVLLLHSLHCMAGSLCLLEVCVDGKVSKCAMIRNRYNQVPHLTQDTNGKVTNSQLHTTNKSQVVSPFPAGDDKAHIKRCAQRHSKHKTEKNIKDSQKKYCLGKVSKIFYRRT